MSNRKQDTITSKEVEKFLDTHYYKEEVERVYDKERQFLGIDVIYKDQFIDEKCATDYINKPLKTFAFELSSVDRNGNRYLGWIVNPRIKTTHYLLCYIDKCKVDKNPIASDIEEMEVIYVSKVAIKDYLARNGVTEESLLNPSEIRGYKVVGSHGKTERPVNILISREVLRYLGNSSMI